MIVGWCSTQRAELPPLSAGYIKKNWRTCHAKDIALVCALVLGVRDGHEGAEEVRGPGEGGDGQLVADADHIDDEY